MHTCEFAWRCGGLTEHLAHKPHLETMYRQRYCDKEMAACARYLVAQTSPLDIPDDLLPNQHYRLAELGIATGQ